MAKTREDAPEVEDKEVESQVEVEAESGDEGDDDLVIEKRGEDFAVPAQRETRKERKEREWQEKMDKAMESRMSPIMQQLEVMRSMMGQQQQAPQLRLPPPVQRNEDFDTIVRKQIQIQETLQEKTAAGTLTSSEREKLVGEWNAQDRKKMKLVAAEDRLEAERARPQTPSRDQLVLSRRFPTLVKDPRVLKSAARMYEEMLEDAEHLGKPITDELEAQATCLQKAGEKFGMIRPSLPARNPGERARFTGGGAVIPGRSGEVRLSSMDRDAALTMYSDHIKAGKLTEQQAISRWIKDVRAKGYDPLA
jgi:hypothetical protein